MSVNSLSSGTTSEITGNIEVAMITAAASVLNRNSNRARQYAANVPITRVSRVVVPATTTLLSRDRPNPTSGLNTARKFSTDHGRGSGGWENWAAGRRNAETTIQQN